MTPIPVPIPARRLVADFEGFAPKAYLCPAGVWTIGFGFTHGVRPGQTISRIDAEIRLDHELAEFALGVQRLLARHPTPNQFGAMVSLAFNIGLSGFARSSVLRLHNAGDFEGAARAFALWNKAGGKVLAGLVRRRAAEAAMYLTPEIPLQRVDREIVSIPQPDGEVLRFETPEPPPLPMPQQVDEERPMARSRIAQGAGISGGVAGLTLAAEGARAVGDIRFALGDWLPYIALGVIVVAAGWILWERVQQRRKGIA